MNSSLFMSSPCSKSSPFTVAFPIRLIARLGVADSALALATRSHLVFTVIKDVLWREFVAVYAVRFLSVFGLRAVTSQRVYSWCHRLNVRRVDAMTAVTQMVSLKFRWGNNFNEKFIGESVGIPVLAVVPEGGITVVQARRPQPARNTFERNTGIDPHLREKTDKKRAVNGNSVRMGLHGLFSLDVGQVVWAAPGVTSRAALSF